jgi:DNA-binding NarL/FixJ family response regulator
MKRIRLILTDDHPIVREGIRQLMSRAPEIEVVAEAENGKHLLEILQNTQADLVLLDLTMPVLNGLDTIPLLRLKHPSLRIVVLSMHEEPDYIIRAIQSGAHGYLMKSAGFDELYMAIRTVLDGKKYFPGEVSRIVLENLGSFTNEGSPTITGREREILNEVAAGLSNKQIADKLSISTRTVETHRMNLLKKLDAGNSAELIRKASEYHMI